MMKRVGLGWLYPGGCEFVTWQTQGGNELSGEPGWSAQANRKIYLTTAELAFIKDLDEIFPLGPECGNAGPFLIGLFLCEVRPGELPRYLFTPLAAGNLRATHVFHAEHMHGLCGMSI